MTRSRAPSGEEFLFETSGQCWRRTRIINLEGQKRNLINKVILWNAQLSDLGKAIDHKNQQLKRMGK